MALTPGDALAETATSLAAAYRDRGKLVCSEFEMTTEELGKKDSVEELSNDVSTSETESSYSTDAIAIPTFSLLDKDFMEMVFGASLDEQAQ